MTLAIYDLFLASRTDPLLKATSGEPSEASLEFFEFKVQSPMFNVCVRLTRCRNFSSEHRFQEIEKQGPSLPSVAPDSQTDSGQYCCP